jgi:hypothetical protein
MMIRRTPENIVSSRQRLLRLLNLSAERALICTLAYLGAVFQRKLWRRFVSDGTAHLYGSAITTLVCLAVIHTAIPKWLAQ